MSDISVNDHLEGILSDFEALKRSFDVDDVDELPRSSPVPSPLSPTSLLNKTNEGRALAASNYGAPAFRSRSSLGSNPSPVQSPVLKSRMVSSVSFNRGTMNRPFMQNNGGGSVGVARASSFQSRFNPNGFSSSMSGPGSDNDSLHSSSSSLEYSIQSAGGGPGQPGSPSYFASPQTDLRPGKKGGEGLGIVSPALKKFSSHGSVFHTELEGPIVVEAPGTRGVNHGSMPSLELQVGEEGGGMMGLRRTGGGAPRYGNVGWNGGAQRHNSTSPSGIESYHPPSQKYTSYQAQPRPKEAQRLNKFPLDLESLVGVKLPPSSDPPRPAPRAQCPNSLSVSASSSPSISSLDSSSVDLTPVPPSLPLSSPSASPPGAMSVPKVSHAPMPLSPAQTPQLNLLSPRPQVGRVAPSPSAPPSAPPSASPSFLPSTPPSVRSLL
ncbi:hypothetical protein UPYG_G00095010 [Umbra pygmaea]|uniref:Uncharacterized protein n=1 Tax=Umbra pygmaea TaxID=75934 RepID=A0ABD0WZN1_UMBPY